MQKSFLYIILCLIFVFWSIIIQSDARQCYVCGTGADEPFKNRRDSSANSRGFDKNLTTSSSSTNNSMVQANFNKKFISSCQEFDKNNNNNIKNDIILKDFMMECPLNYVGCLIQTDGNHTTRTCDLLPLNDCQIANGIKYCYCSTDLCNGKIELSTTTVKVKKTGLRENGKVIGKKKGGIGNDMNGMDDSVIHKPTRFLERNSDDEDLIESSGMEDKYPKILQDRNTKDLLQNNNNKKNNNNNDISKENSGTKIFQDNTFTLITFLFILNSLQFYL